MKPERNVYRVQAPRNKIQFIADRETREELKPIVFFDAGSFRREDSGFQIGFHPHSGIGIITYFQGTDLHHEDSAENDGIIRDGGAQWIRAGNGIWHQEAYRPKHNIENRPWTGSILQLWLQLPPEYEESEPEYTNLLKEEIPTFGNVKVLVGNYNGVMGRMNVPVNMTYLDVHLKEGGQWEFKTPDNQKTGFIFNRHGVVQSGPVQISQNQMGILERNDGVIRIKAIQDATFVLITAQPGIYPIVSSGSQIHTNIGSLERSARNIEEIGRKLKLRSK